MTTEREERINLQIRERADQYKVEVSSTEQGGWLTEKVPPGSHPGLQKQIGHASMLRIGSPYIFL